MSLGSNLLCVFSCGIYPHLWKKLKAKINFNSWNLKTQISFGVMLTLLLVQLILVSVLIVSSKTSQCLL